MSAPRKRTAAGYLVERGWTTDGDELWSDPDGVAALSEEHAVTIQRARDAEAERKAWVAFAAAAVATVSGAASEHALFADSMVAAYRARFAVEIVDEPEAVS